MRLVVQRAVLLVARRPAREGDYRAQGHLRHPVLVEHADRVVHIALDHELALAGEVQEPQHVAGGERGDERLLGIDPARRRHGARNVRWRGVALHRDVVFEAPEVPAAVGLVDEVAPVARPLDAGAVLAHIRNTPKRVLSIGAFSAAEMPRPSRRRVSAGSTTPSSQSRALA